MYLIYCEILLIGMIIYIMSFFTNINERVMKIAVKLQVSFTKKNKGY